MTNPLLFQDALTEADVADIRLLPGPILVVGASGFIGAKLFFALLKQRQDVYALSQHINHSWRLLQWPGAKIRRNFINVDITQPDRVEECLQASSPS